MEFNETFFTDQLQESQTRNLDIASEKLHELMESRCTGHEMLGWYNYPKKFGRTVCEEIGDFAKSISCHYDLVVVIGIGGSYLGTRTVHDALSHSYGLTLSSPNKEQSRLPMVFIGHHLAEGGLVETLDLLERFHPIVNVVSKSGTTTEPAIAFRVVRSYLENRFGKSESAQRIIATTDSESGALRELAKSEGYKAFSIPADIGGRFSVLSPVGLLPLALAGHKIASLLDGADQVFTDCENTANQPETNPVLRYSAARKAAYDQGKSVEMLVTGEPKLFSLAEWWKQLFGESEGKGHKGILPCSLQYTTDLHSLGQFMQDGTRMMFETFLKVEQPRSKDAMNVERRLRVPSRADNLDQLGYLEDRFVDEINQAALNATKIAHFDGQTPCLEIGVPELSEYTIGQLFAFFQTSCAVSALSLGVNPFDQPGVEQYKRNLFGLMGKPGFEDEGAEMRRRLK